MLLALLQEDISLPISEVAERVGLSTTPCWRRIRRLEEHGMITRRVALIDRRRAGVPLTVYLSVRMSQRSQERFDEFRQLVREIPEIVEAHRVSGPSDFLMKLVLPSIEAYDVVYMRLIETFDLSEIHCSIAVEELKYTTAVPTSYA